MHRLNAITLNGYFSYVIQSLQGNQRVRLDEVTIGCSNLKLPSTREVYKLLQVSRFCPPGITLSVLPCFNVCEQKWHENTSRIAGRIENISYNTIQYRGAFRAELVSFTRIWHIYFNPHCFLRRYYEFYTKDQPGSSLWSDLTDIPYTYTSWFVHSRHLQHKSLC